MNELFLVFLVTGVLGTLLLLMNKILGPKKSNQDRITPVPIKYYLVAFLFLLFDVEVVFLFPWALVFKKIGSPALIYMAAYILILALGFIYAWKKGAFLWEK